MADGSTSAGFAAPVEFGVWLPGPIDARSSLEPFKRSGDDLIDRWDGETLVRTIRMGKGVVAYACTPVGTMKEPTFRVAVENPSHREEVERAARKTFVPALPEFTELLRRDTALARLNELYPGLRQVRQLDLLAPCSGASAPSR